MITLREEGGKEREEERGERGEKKEKKLGSWLQNGAQVVTSSGLGVGLQDFKSNLK